MTDFLIQRIARQPRSLFTQAVLGAVLAGIALAIRLGLAPLIGLGAPFAAFLLAVLVAAVFGGVRSAVTCAALLAIGGVVLLEPSSQPLWAQRRTTLGVAFFMASSGFTIWTVALLRAALRREMAAREGERLLKLELHHRVKNTLAIVQSLADQTFRGADDTEAARRQFAARLKALAGAHDLLVDGGWRDVTLQALAQKALAPFRPSDPQRLVLDGDATSSVGPEVAVPIALCLHELATNATKYGALSGDQGQVQLSWRITTEGRPRLSLDWRESGGPPTDAGRGGFGSRLLARALAAQPNAESRLDYPPQGARWWAAFDL